MNQGIIDVTPCMNLPDFLQIDNNSVFSKQRALQKGASFQSRSYNEVVLTKQICFSLTVFKLLNSHLR